MSHQIKAQNALKHIFKTTGKRNKAQVNEQKPSLTSAEDSVEHLLKLLDTDGLVLQTHQRYRGNSQVKHSDGKSADEGEAAVLFCFVFSYITSQLFKKPPQAFLLI